MVAKKSETFYNVRQQDDEAARQRSDARLAQLVEPVLQGMVVYRAL